MTVFEREKRRRGAETLNESWRHEGGFCIRLHHIQIGWLSLQIYLAHMTHQLSNFFPMIVFFQGSRGTESDKKEKRGRDSFLTKSHTAEYVSVQFSSVQSLSRVRLFATP